MVFRDDGLQAAVAGARSYLVLSKALRQRSAVEDGAELLVSQRSESWLGRISAKRRSLGAYFVFKKFSVFWTSLNMFHKTKKTKKAFKF